MCESKTIGHDLRPQARLVGVTAIGGPLAATQPTDIFSQSLIFVTQLMGFPEGRGRWDPQHRVLGKTSQCLPEAFGT
jgi:hypothetical protein